MLASSAANLKLFDSDPDPVCEAVSDPDPTEGSDLSGSAILSVSVVLTVCYF
jgi:hypothetical protein